MYKIINRHVYDIASGENITLCDIIADSASDLPGADDIAVNKIVFGSFAYVIDEGVFYSLDSSGTWNGGSYSDVVDEVITARGSFSTLDARLDDMDVILNSAKLGIKYKGAVNYYNNLPATGNKIGDAYTVKYAGSSGTTPDGTEYVWGELGGVVQWIDFSKDCYTKSEINTMLAGKQDALNAGQLAAVNSGINSTKVAQISQNATAEAKDNAAIIDLINDGAKNKLPIPAISDISGTLPGNTTINADGTITIILPSNLTSESGINYTVNLPAGTFHYSSGENSSTDGTYDCFIQTYASGSWVTVLRDNTTNPGQTATIEAGSYRVTIRFRSGAPAGTYVFKPMLCFSSYWNITETYVPYRP